MKSKENPMSDNENRSISGVYLTANDSLSNHACDCSETEPTNHLYELAELRRHVVQLQQENESLRQQLDQHKITNQSNSIDCNHLLQMVIDYVPQAIFWKDCDSVYLGCNRQFAEKAGLQHPREIVGKTDHDLPWTPQEAKLYQELDRQVMSSKSPQIKLRGTRHLVTGAEILVETTKIPLYNHQGNIVGLLGILDDIGDRLQQEELLKQRLAAIEAGTDGIALQTSQGVFTYVNRAYLEMFGYSKTEDILGKTWQELYDEDEIEYIRREVSPVFAAENEWQGELRSRRQDGSFFIQEMSLTKSAAGVVCICRDVTDRKQAEATLMLYKQAVESSSDAIAMADAQWNHFYQNPAFSEMFGCETPEEFNQVFGGISGAYTDPQIPAQIFAEISQGKNWVGEVEHRAKNNRVFQVLLRASAIKDGLGNILGAVASLTDITARKKAEANLREITSDLQEAQELAHIGNWELDLETGEITWSDEVFRILGLDQTLGMPSVDECLQCYHPEDRPLIEKALAETRNNGTACQVEARILRDDNSVSYVHVKFKAILNHDNQIVSLFGTIMDITERKRAEIHLQQQTEKLEKALVKLKRTQTQLIQSEKMSGLGQMVAGVAHEINNPVGFIVGNVSHLEEYTQDLLLLIESYRQYYTEPPLAITELIEEIDLNFLITDIPQLINSIQNGARRIQEIVNSLQSFSRLNESEIKEIDIHQGIDSTLMVLKSRLRPLPGEREIMVIKNYGDLPKIECYAGQINQVFLHIFNNAIDALKNPEFQEYSKQPTLTITTGLHKNKLAFIRIADNGVGIPEELRSRIFDPFFTTKPVGQGTGLGLSVSYQIVVDLHKGKLNCTSEMGMGSEFCIQIPIHNHDNT
ncbi:PAS domain S-box protein [Limnospira platensis CENA597]|uniref:PAS domain S-box protein n=2 Tax=Limnospira platensis TaxID=118562 RepID=UPI003DA12F97